MRRRWNTLARGALTALAAAPLVVVHAAAQASRQPPRFDERLNLERIISMELARFPKARPDDVYDLVYHAAMGPGHEGTDSAKAAAQLRVEWNSLGKLRPGEPMLDTISPDGRFVRLNLRPWRAAGGSRGPLGRAFIETSHEGSPDASLLEHYWRIVETMGTDNKLPWPVDSVSMLGRRMAGSGFPEGAHSAAYATAYEPAYRVFSAARADSLVHSLPPAKPVKPVKTVKPGKPGKPAKSAKSAKSTKGAAPKPG